MEPKRAGSTVAAKVVQRLKKAGRGKVVNLASVVAGRRLVDELQTQVASAQDLVGLEPAHAAYVYAQNQVSVLSEQLTELKELAPFGEMISKAEDLFMPSGPPMSPLTTSFFTSWAFFDACVGPARETIGTTILAVGAAFGMHSELLRIIRSMQESRMGIYLHCGVEGRFVVLEDIVTGAARRCIAPSGYRGQKGELWYVRALPPPLLGLNECVLFTTPYVLLSPGFHEWLAYFNRAVAQHPGAKVADYECHLKFGPTRQYWNDFVFEAYVSHRTDVIYLSGLPDLPESRPHSKVNGWRFAG